MVQIGVGPKRETISTFSEQWVAIGRLVKLGNMRLQWLLEKNFQEVFDDPLSVFLGNMLLVYNAQLIEEGCHQVQPRLLRSIRK